MKKRTRLSRFARRIALLGAAALSLAPACGKDNPADPGERLCGSSAGFGARIVGRTEPVDACISDGDVTVLITTGSHYSVTATEVTAEVTFEFFVVFPVIGQDAPAILNFHDDLGAAQADPFGVYLHYQEIPDQGDAIESVEITDGTFTLSFSAGDVLTATMSGVTMKMRTTGGTPQDAGTRSITQGFMSLSVDG